MEPVNECCLQREVAVRLQRSRALVLSRALREIARCKSLDKAKSIASAANEAEWIVLTAMDGLPLPKVEP